jgi:hypothetical protein
MSLELKSVRLQRYNASELYWEVPGSNLGRGIVCPDRGIHGFLATLKANDGIDKISQHQFPFACCQIDD